VAWHIPPTYFALRKKNFGVAPSYQGWLRLHAVHDVCEKEYRWPDSQSAIQKAQAWKWFIETVFLIVALDVRISILATA
jgi:hypothetical protein